MNQCCTYYAVYILQNLSAIYQYEVNLQRSDKLLKPPGSSQTRKLSNCKQKPTQILFKMFPNSSIFSFSDDPMCVGALEKDLRPNLINY